MLYAYRHDAHTHVRAIDGLGGPVRLILHPKQIELVHCYYKTRPIEVCSVNFFEDCPISNHEVALDVMQSINAPAHAGGWRLLEEPEYRALVVGASDPNRDVEDPGSLIHLALHKHPATRSGVTFAYPDCLTLPLVVLMQEIYDVRRFADPSGKTVPKLSGCHHWSRMKSYFRIVDPSTTLKLHTGNEARTNGQMRCVLATNAWRMQPFQQYPRDEIEADPRAFLFRHYFKHLALYRKSQTAETAAGVAMWKTTQRFMHFVRQLWLSGLGQDKFDPERFFERPDEIESFLEFIKPVDIDKPSSNG